MKIQVKHTFKNCNLDQVIRTFLVFNRLSLDKTDIQPVNMIIELHLITWHWAKKTMPQIKVYYTNGHEISLNSVRMWLNVI